MLYDSETDVDMQSDKSMRTESSEEDDTIDINPSRSTLFTPTETQLSTWISHQKRRPEDGQVEWTKIRVNRLVKK